MPQGSLVNSCIRNAKEQGMQYGKDYDVDRQPEVSLENEGNVNVLARSRTNTNWKRRSSARSLINWKHVEVFHRSSRYKSLVSLFEYLTPKMESFPLKLWIASSRRIQIGRTISKNLIQVKPHPRCLK